MFDAILDKAYELKSKGEAFAIAIVVNYKAPISGKPGFKAIIRPDGNVFGWVGGGCSQPLVVQEAIRSIEDGKPRLVKISPDAQAHEDGVIQYAMTCHSEGTLEVYIEPVIPNPKIVILGKSPVGQALSRLALAIHYHVVVMAPNLNPEDFPGVEAVYSRFDQKILQTQSNSCIVVATQGEDDEEALELALSLNYSYLAFVASKKKIQHVFDYLKHKNISQEKIETIHAPAGLDLGGRLPEEIAVSIIAEIIAEKRVQQTQVSAEIQSETTTTKPELYKNPVCGMMIDKSTAKFVVDYEGNPVYFCCTGCKVEFERVPEKYAASV
ncbi:MAG: XdhC family protein [Microscillaceae bacterium]|nr:XdhC family protein [Microscillaceae bacterium]